VVFDATIAGTRDDTQLINYNDGITSVNTQRPVTGNGQDSPSTLTISDGPTYDYGSIDFNSTKDYTFTVTFNAGADPSVNSISESGLAAPYSMPGGYPGTGGNCGDPISGNCTIVVRYAPTAVSAADNDQIVLNYTNGAGAQTATRDVTGAAVNSPPVVAGFSPASPAASTEITDGLTFSITSSSDPNGDNFTIRWLVDGVEAQAACSPNCTTDSFTPVTTYQTNASYTVTAEFNDGTDTSTQVWTWNVTNAQDHLMDQNTTLGTAANDYGYRVITGHDITGDGIDDFAVAEPQASGKGILRIVNGATGAEHCSFTGSDNGGNLGFGLDMGVIGGAVHVVVGAPNGPTNGPGGNRRKGRVLTFDGSNTGGICTAIQNITGAAANDELGQAVKIIPDVNGDGNPDIAISSIPLGTVDILDGDDFTTNIGTISGSSTTEFGYSLDTVADLADNGDGEPELLIGDPGTTNGSVYVYSLNEPTFTLIDTRNGTAFGDRFGESIAVIGDVTGDGDEEYIAGAPAAISGDGEALVIRTDTWAIHKTFTGTASSAEALGSCVANAGDVNNDGSDDIIVGFKNGDYSALTDNGKVVVYSGKGSESYREYYTFEGANASDFMGTSCSGGAQYDAAGNNLDFIVGGDGRATSYSSSD
jgi:hypothetical protein